jgi:hypothetical protein
MEWGLAIFLRAYGHGLEMVLSMYVRILYGRSWAGNSSMTSRRQLDHGQAGQSCVITRYDRNLRKKLFAIWCLAASDHFEGLHYRNGFKAYLLIYLHTDV